MVFRIDIGQNRYKYVYFAIFRKFLGLPKGDVNLENLEELFIHTLILHAVYLHLVFLPSINFKPFCEINV